MKFYYLVHSMLAQKGANAIKIVSVAVGLLVSCLIFTRLAYNYSYDTCFRDYDRLYQVKMSYETNGEKLGPFESCVGKLSGGIYNEIGEYVEAATNIYRGGGGTLFDGDTRIDIEKIGSDSLFFETMGIPVISGRPKSDLAMPNVIYLSESLARKLYGGEEPVGRTLSLDKETQLTVKGVFKDVPENISVYWFEAVISMPTFPQQIERRFHWSGGDSWPTYLRLRDDCKLSVEELNRIANQMYQSHVPDSDENKGFLHVAPIRETYLGYDEVKKMNMVMWALGVSLLLMTTFNYVLITIASLSRRAKGIGVHKCSGASSISILGMFLGETAVILGCAFVIMVVLLFTFEPLIEDIIDLSIPQILAPSRLWVSGAILLFFFLVGGVLPGRLYARIPVAQVFRRFTERNSAWKRSLLFVQIGGVAFVAGLLALVAVQYVDIMNRSQGFEYKDKVRFSIPALDMETRSTLFMGGIEGQPYVTGVSWSVCNPLQGYSGDYVFSATGNILFNTRIDWVDANFVKFMGMPLLQGSYELHDGDMVVNETFARRMGWGDNALGQHPETIEGSLINIAAVVKDYSVGDINEEIPPVILKVTNWCIGDGYASLKEPFDENYKKLESYLTETYPDFNSELRTMSKIHDDSYRSVLLFRNSAIVTAVALVFIALMGLIGFSRDEVERRRKEIAIRKVNGADSMSVISLIAGDVMKIALPATVIGTLCAWYVGSLWLENFSVHADNIFAWYILTSLVVLALVLACVVCVTWRIANENPVTQLKSE